NGYFRSAKRRVVAEPNQKDRYSMLLFIHPRHEDSIGPIDACIALTGGEVKYAKATRWELLMERLADINLATPDMLKELANSGLMDRLIEVGRASPDAMKRLADNDCSSNNVKNNLATK
ncbi:MAG: hypothetical protein KAR79_04965, partial [Simkaniaceae bacterium]|nr:hypothetical protein [Simkaniaceae bacterium]